MSNKKSRRQFVLSVAAGVPLLALAGKVEAQQTSDPVLDQILADFKELKREGDEKPAQRRAAVRGFETLTGVLAAHYGKNYDADLKRVIRRGLQTKGRQALVHEITSKINKPGITHEKVDAALALMERDGLAGVLREGQKAFKRVRENAPEVMQVKLQFDFCADARWYADLYDMMAQVACIMSAVFGGTNFAADLACIMLGIEAVAFKATIMWMGC